MPIAKYICIEYILRLPELPLASYAFALTMGMDNSQVKTGVVCIVSTAAGRQSQVLKESCCSGIRCSEAWKEVVCYSAQPHGGAAERICCPAQGSADVGKNNK